MQARATEARVMEDRGKGLSDYPNFKSSAPTLILDLLRLLEFIREGKVSNELRGMIEKTTNRFVKDDPNLGIQAARGAALMLTVLYLAHKKCPDIGLSTNLVHELTDAAGLALITMEASET
jgi:hypothetical protein